MNKPFNMKGWRTMDSAPKDGTEIIILETPNGEHFNIMVACYMAWMSETDQDKWIDVDNTPRVRWWGTYPTHWSRNGPHHTHWKPIACTPLCWKPMLKHTFSKKQLRQLMYLNENIDET